MILEAQVRMWARDSDLPRDAAINTLHFNHLSIDPLTPGVDATALASDIADVFDTGWVDGKHLSVKIYDVHGAKPRDPLAEVELHKGVSGSAPSIPREVALCLSFYATHNRPKWRGRIYLPVYLTSTGIDQRPPDALMAKALSLATEPNNSLPDIGGVDVKWGVYSRVDDEFRQVTDGWVDDEWDTVRRRGLRATKRVTFHREGQLLATALEHLVVVLTLIAIEVLHEMQARRRASELRDHIRASTAGRHPSRETDRRSG